MNPKISVIIPVYNVEKYLDQCLQTVCQPGNVEILCIEDCSTDGSLDILKEYEKKDNRITIIQHTENRGLSAARNTGISYAKGDYIMLVDSDDMLKPGAYMTVIYNMRKDNLDALRFNAEMIIDESMKGKGTRMGPFWWRTPAIYPEHISGKQMFVDQKLNGHYRQPAQLYALKRQFLLDNNLKFQEGIYYEDELFTMSMLMKAQRVSAIKDLIYIYRYRENSITSMEKQRKHFDSHVFVIESIMKNIYTDEPERIKRAILLHLCFLFRMLSCNVSELSIELTDYEKELVELSKCTPQWMQCNMIEKFIHKYYE